MRSVEAHTILARHDHALPGLPVLLDDAALGRRLGRSVRRSYLRYKHGTSAAALLDVDGRAAIAYAWGAGRQEKRAKALRHAAAGDVLLDEPAEGLLVVDAMTDRHLPALHGPVRDEALDVWLSGLGHPVVGPPTTLAHKPARRWVGRVDVEGGRRVVLRAYTRGGLEEAVHAHGLVDARHAPVRLPRLIGTHRRGLLALEHLPGRVLDETVSSAGLRRLGACLGRLHSTRVVDVVGAEHPATTYGLRTLSAVLGDTVTRAEQIDARARASLRPGPGALVHGDFSLDQAVAHGHELGIIDLDRVRIGNPLDDVASLLAAAGLAVLPAGGVPAALAVIDRMRPALLSGHRSTWRRGVTDDLGPRTALELLSRSTEPFRSGHADWPATTHDLVTLARTVADGRAAA